MQGQPRPGGEGERLLLAQRPQRLLHLPEDGIADVLHCLGLLGTRVRQVGNHALGAKTEATAFREEALALGGVGITHRRKGARYVSVAQALARANRILQPAGLRH